MPKQRGIKLFYYAQIDNPLAEICDPVLIGYHLLGPERIDHSSCQETFCQRKGWQRRVDRRQGPDHRVQRSARCRGGTNDGQWRFEAVGR